MIDDILENQKALQEEYGYPICSVKIEEKTELLRTYSLAALDEIHEVLKEFSWKSWAGEQFINRDEAVSEIVDVFLFLSNMLVVLESNEEEFLEVVKKKIDKNWRRTGKSFDYYDSKCKSCKRALDDFYEEIRGESECPICKKEQKRFSE